MLPPTELTRLLFLLGMHSLGRSKPDDDHELRLLVAREFPQEAATYPFPLLMDLAYGIAAVPYFMRAMGEAVDVPVS